MKQGIKTRLEKLEQKHNTKITGIDVVIEVEKRMQAAGEHGLDIFDSSFGRAFQKHETEVVQKWGYAPAHENNTLSRLIQRELLPKCV